MEFGVGRGPAAQRRRVGSGFGLYRATPEYRRLMAPRGWGWRRSKSSFSGNGFIVFLGGGGDRFAVPLAWFALRSAIPRGYGWRLVALAPCSGRARARSAGTWSSRASLTAPMSAISACRRICYRLVHLRRAGVDRARPPATGKDRRDRPARLIPLASVAALVLPVQLLLGAWVAGLNAGPVASDWPLMQGQLIPDGIDARAGPVRADPRPVPDPLPPSLVGVDCGRRAGGARPPGRNRSTAAPRSPSTARWASRSCSASPP